MTDQANGNGNNPVGNQVNAPPVSDQTNGNGNNPVGNQVNAPPVSDQDNGNGNNPVGKDDRYKHTRQQFHISHLRATIC